MKIKFLSSDGVLQEEQDAFKAIQRSFPADWLGFGGFQLMQRGAQPLDIDLLVLTPNRILIVELKNWKGTITFADQMWMHGRRTAKSPVHLANFKCKILSNLLRQKLSSTLRPKIDPIVVLCHPTSNHQLPESESQHVVLLEEFCNLGRDYAAYLNRFPQIPPDWTAPSPNPLASAAKYELLFMPGQGHIGERRFAIQGFEQLRVEPDYVHPKRVYSEYGARDQDSKRARALLRRWDFNQLNDGNTTQAERSNIALRETRLNEAIRLQSPELHKDLLEPIGRPTPDEVSTHFAEAYRIGDRLQRLSDQVPSNGKDQSAGETIALVKSIFARFADLHRLGIAHRDIGAKSIWIEPPARIVLSSFAAAFFPEQETLGEHRPMLSTGAVAAPEDSILLAGSTPFNRDVYLLGALAYELIFDSPLKPIDASAPAEAAIHHPILGNWFGKTLAYEPALRYQNAEKALDALNEVTPGAEAQTVRRDDLIAYETQAGPGTYLPKTQLSMQDGKWLYRCDSDHGPLLVKLWTSLNYDDKRPTRNRTILSFLENARRLKQSKSQDHSEIVDFGMGPLGLVLVTKWIEGTTLTEWMSSERDRAERADAARNLIQAVLRVHGQGVTHGDLKPDNVLMRRSATGESIFATLIDLPDLRPDGDSGVTPAYLPPGSIDLSPIHRDLFATASIVYQILLPQENYFSRSLKECQRALERADEGCPIALIAEQIEQEMAPSVEHLLEFQVGHRGNELNNHPLIGDNDRFPVGLAPGKIVGESFFFINGVSHQLRIAVGDATGEVKGIWVRPLSHIEYVRNSARSSISIRCRINLRWGVRDDATALVQHLRSLSVATDPQQEENSPDTDDEDSLASHASAIAGEAISTRSLWSALAAFEDEAITRITVRSEAEPDPRDVRRLLVAYDLDAGSMEYGSDEEVEMLSRRYDPATGLLRWARVTTIDIDNTTDSVLAVHVSRRRSLDLQPGAVYGIRGRFDRIAADRRRLAMRRILDDRSVLRGLPDYFDPKAELEPSRYSVPPNLDVAQYALNTEQKMALDQALTSGPIALLQGPPGTGKTKFIASFVHCVLSNALAENILLVSQSHEAVNHALEKVAALYGTNAASLSIVRVGKSARDDGSSAASTAYHESAHQQRYREIFAAELKSRIYAAAKPLLLPNEYVIEVVEFYLDIGQLKRRLDTLAGEMTASAPGDDVDERASRFASLLDKFRVLARRKYATPLAAGDYQKALEKIRLEIESKHGSPSPAKCRQLEQVVETSLEFSKVLRNPAANFTSFLARAYEIVAGTCVGIGRQGFGIVDHAYDWVIIDEAARSSATELAVAMQVGRRILLVGDHKQLPPTGQTAGFERQLAEHLGVTTDQLGSASSFERAFLSSYGKSVGTTLRTQYRMAPAIGKLVSNCFYNDTPLHTERDPIWDEYDELPSLLKHQVTWIDTSDRGRAAFETRARRGGKSNEAEVNVVLAVLRKIAETPAFLEGLARRDVNRDAIGVIAMYAAQRDLLRHKFDQADWAVEIRHLVSIGTVDSYQGKENRIIITSLVRNNPDNDIGFLRRPERINVAMSRAMDRLIIVGATAMWRHRHELPLNEVLKHIETSTSIDDTVIIPSMTIEDEI